MKWVSSRLFTHVHICVQAQAELGLRKIEAEQDGT